MNDIKRFEDLDAWKIARELCNMIYGITKNKPMSNDYGFSDQIRRAAVSIMNNIAEGFERGSNKDFAKFLFIARGSAGEVRSMLYLALDQAYINAEEFKDISDLCVRASQLCWGMIKHLQKNSDWKTGIVEDVTR
jgi:four helix bundle protein